MFGKPRLFVKHWPLAVAVFVVVIGVAAWLTIPATNGREANSGSEGATATPVTINVVPEPVSIKRAKGADYSLDAKTAIASDVSGIGSYLVGILRTSTGLPLPTATGAGGIQLRLSGAPGSVGDDGYQLVTSKSGVTIRANKPAGLFAGVQTLLQLLPPAAMSDHKQSATWIVPGGTITDYPRFAYRGAMLDVARHFFAVDQVKRFIDQLALYKINYLHLHLSDDQGWRMAVAKWPNLATLGGSTEVEGGPGGFYSQADYSAIVDYAASRYITVVPEIDMPGHTNAALASYADLNCDGKAPNLYTGVEVGFSSLCVSKALTYTFIDDVVGELAALTKGPYIHIGGDESKATKPADYVAFIDRAQKIVQAHHKTVIGWHDVTNSHLLPSTVAQFWSNNTASNEVVRAMSNGTKVIMSPANHAYLDMKYNNGTTLGQTWAGLIDVGTAYGWNPGAYIPGFTDKSVLGVEACLWTETIVTPDDIDYMVFPRLPAIAELGWSPWKTHGIEGFRTRLTAQEPRWDAMGIKYARDAAS